MPFTLSDERMIPVEPGQSVDSGWTDEAKLFLLKMIALVEHERQKCKKFDEAFAAVYTGSVAGGGDARLVGAVAGSDPIQAELARMLGVVRKIGKKRKASEDVVERAGGKPRVEGDSGAEDDGSVGLEKEVGGGWDELIKTFGEDAIGETGTV